MEIKQQEKKNFAESEKLINNNIVRQNETDSTIETDRGKIKFSNYENSDKNRIIFNEKKTTSLIWFLLLQAKIDLN